jgi:hypothetical protein
MSEHQHEAGPINFRINSKGDYAHYYTCKECGLDSEEGWESKSHKPSVHEHIDYVDGCFACKLLTLQVSKGDAGRAESMSAKKWDGELEAYRDARRQGIQPAGTTMSAINKAKEASQKLGTAYNADSMPAAERITKQTAKVMKETGAI